MGGESRPGEIPPAPAAPPASPPAEPVTKPETEEPFDRDRAMRTIETLRQEAKDAKALKKQVDELTAKVQAHDAEKLSDVEKKDREIAALKTERDQLAADRRTLLVRTEIERQARKLGIVDEDAAYRLLDLDALELNEDGTPKNVEKLLTRLLEAKPYLKATSETRPGVPPTPRANGNPAADLITENRQKLQATGAYGRF